MSAARKEGFPVLLFDSLKCDNLCNVTRVTRVTRGCRLAEPDNRYVEAGQGHVPRVCSPLPHCSVLRLYLKVYLLISKTMDCGRGGGGLEVTGTGRRGQHESPPAAGATQPPHSQPSTQLSRLKLALYVDCVSNNSINATDDTS